MHKILILGDGQLGSSIHQLKGWDFISRKKDGFDARTPNFMLLDSYDIIVNCIGFTDTYSNDKKSNWDINYRFVSELVDFCNSKKKKLVHISTDYVYSNSKSNASEEDVPVHCANWYGYTKLLGDGYIQLKSEEYLIIRCSFKPHPFPYPKALVCQIGNFDWTCVIANMICSLIDKKAIGIFNVGTEPKTVYELAKYSRDVEPMFDKIHETMPTDITMNCTKMKKEFMENNQPLVSICVPTSEMRGNGVTFLKDLLKSIEEQTYQNIEVVISDQSSDNETEEYVSNYKKTSNLIIKYVRDKEGRKSLSANLNNTMDHASGEYLKLIGQDDLFAESYALEVMLQKIQGYNWLTSSCTHFTDDIKTTFKPHQTSWPGKSILDGNNLIGAVSAILIKKTDVRFDEDLVWLLDCDFYYRLYLRYGLPVCMEEPLILIRRWEGCISGSVDIESIEKKESAYVKGKEEMCL